LNRKWEFPQPALFIHTNKKGSCRFPSHYLLVAEGLEAWDALGGILAFLKSGANLDFRREGLGTNENRDQGWRGW